MMKLFLLSLILLIFNSNCFSQEENQKTKITLEKKFQYPDRIRYDGSCLTIDGKDIFIFSAAFHYFRCPQELWRDRFQKIKEAGFNTVETYVPWNWHERNIPKDENDYSQCDFSDLKAWLKMAHEEFGFYTILRPGPFICAEWAGGAYPRWLAKFCPEKYQTSFWLRSDHPEHIKWSKHWYNAVCPVIASDQITRKPKGSKGTILVQLENEYIYFDMSPEGKIKVLKALYESAKSNGIEIPLFTCVTPEARDCRDLEISQVFDMDNQYVWWNMAEAKDRIQNLKKEQSDAPAFVCELQGGWFSTVGGKLSEDSYLDRRHARGMALMAVAGGATGLNYYMLFGGTNLAGWGARRMTTTYDYGAAIKENGGVGEKYLSVKGIGDFLEKYGDKLTRSVPTDYQINSDTTRLISSMLRAKDGTRFLFLLNRDKKEPFSGEISLQSPNQPLLNFICNIKPCDSKVLVLQPMKTAVDQEDWYPKEQSEFIRPKKNPEPVRVSTAWKCDEDFDVKWQPLKTNISLPELGVNDCRYSLYKSEFNLSADDLKKYGTLVFDMFTADPVFIQVNGKITPRVSSSELDNTFNVAGQLKTGKNSIVALYENQGHAHGYKPMEELSGIQNGGLSAFQESITPVEDWEVINATGNEESDISEALNRRDGWQKMMLDEETIAGLSTLQIAGLSKPKWPAAWILQGKSGTAVYRTHINFTPEMIRKGKTVLEFGCIDDWGILYINGNEVARHDAWDKVFECNVAGFVKPGVNEIAVAVTNANGSGGLTKPVRLLCRSKIEKPLKWYVSGDLSGVLNHWISGKTKPDKWEMITLDSLSIIQRKGNNIQPKGNNNALFTWYKVDFELPDQEKGVWIPWRLLIDASGTGYMWLNGQNIGRYWEIGPQREFYLPECWLRFGKGNKNTLVFGLRQSSKNGAILKAVEIAPYTQDAEFRK